MKQILSLVRKDLLLVKSYTPIIILLMAGLPFLFLTMESTGTGLPAFFLSYSFGLYLSLQSLSMNEAKFPKAEMLLCAAPYSRRVIVASRYVFAALVYGFALLVYLVLSLAIRGIESITPLEALLSLFIGTLVMGITQPLTYKFGIEKMRYVYRIIIVVTPFLLSNLLTERTVSFHFPGNLSEPVLSSLLALLTVLILILSVIVSIAIYREKEF